MSLFIYFTIRVAEHYLIQFRSEQFLNRLLSSVRCSCWPNDCSRNSLLLCFSTWNQVCIINIFIVRLFFFVESWVYTFVGSIYLNVLQNIIRNAKITTFFWKFQIFKKMIILRHTMSTVKMDILWSPNCGYLRLMNVMLPHHNRTSSRYSELKEVVDSLVEIFLLSEHAHKKAANLRSVYGR